MSRGRPLTRTSTTGLPVATTASSNSSCPPESLSEERDAASPLMRAISPSTSTATALRFAGFFGRLLRLFFDGEDRGVFEERRDITPNVGAVREFNLD